MPPTRKPKEWEKESEIERQIKELTERLPHLPDGRIDYAHSDLALVVTCFVKFQDKILLLRRSDKVRTYQGKWNTAAGYIDELKPLREKALQELSEELGIGAEDIERFTFGEPFEFDDPAIKKTWRVHPVLAVLKHRVEISLDWEHDESRWILPEEIKNFDIVPRVDESLKRVLSI
jgi:isopentenyldiphosphate isomerase